jgi:cellulose synthase/poly-beta-1,6-N-acetylglucosamine synthase-like glycosyltransferase
MMHTIFILSFLAVFYAYFGYPLVLKALIQAGFRRNQQSTEADLESKHSSVSIVIAARNEQGVIAEKIENTLDLTYGGIPVRELLNTSLVQVIVASDASDDRTHEIVQGYRSQGVELQSLRERKGKESAQANALKAVKSDIVLFTDAKIFLEGNVLDVIDSYFSDPKIGIVSSVDKVISDDGESSGEGFYIKYEMKLRALESEFNSLVGVSGSCFAVRKDLTKNLATDIPSDFSLLLESVKMGFCGVHAPDLVARYKAVRSEKEEFPRKVRTVLRGITTFFSRVEVLSPIHYGVFSWQIASHKLARWLVPWAGALFVVSSFTLCSEGLFYSLVCLGIAIFFCLAALAWFIPGLRGKTIGKVPLFFLVSNFGIAMAWIKYLRGQRSVTWEPSKKGG